MTSESTAVPEPANSLLPDALSCWQSLQDEAPTLARAVTAALKEKLEGYPLHHTIAADGVTLLKNSSTVGLYRASPLSAVLVFMICCYVIYFFTSLRWW